MNHIVLLSLLTLFFGYVYCGMHLISYQYCLVAGARRRPCPWLISSLNFNWRTIHGMQGVLHITARRVRHEERRRFDPHFQILSRVHGEDCWNTSPVICYHATWWQQWATYRALYCTGSWLIFHVTDLLGIFEPEYLQHTTTCNSGWRHGVEGEAGSVRLIC